MALSYCGAHLRLVKRGFARCRAARGARRIENMQQPPLAELLLELVSEVFGLIEQLYLQLGARGAELLLLALALDSVPQIEHSAGEQPVRTLDLISLLSCLEQLDCQPSSCVHLSWACRSARVQVRLQAAAEVDHAPSADVERLTLVQLSELLGERTQPALRARGRGSSVASQWSV